VVGKVSAANSFVVGEVLWPDRGVQSHDGGVRGAGEGRHGRDRYLELTAKRCCGRQQRSFKDDYRRDRDAAIGVEEQLDSPLMAIGHEDQGVGGLGDDSRAKRHLDDRSAITHLRLRRASFRPLDFEDHGCARSDAEATGGDAEVGWVVEIERR
jgi:hypothetical protein